jgi:hypothetical protein
LKNFVVVDWVMPYLLLFWSVESNLLYCYYSYSSYYVSI